MMRTQMRNLLRREKQKRDHKEQRIAHALVDLPSTQLFAINAEEPAQMLRNWPRILKIRIPFSSDGYLPRYK